jgi:hypothetical protein
VLCTQDFKTAKAQIEKKCSAIPQQADIHAHERKVGFVPKPAIDLHLTARVMTPTCLRRTYPQCFLTRRLVASSYL